MWNWIGQNAQALSFFASVGTLLIWLFYAQLLLNTVRRQKTPRVLVNQGWGNQLDSVCLVSNMSQEPIYIQCIVMRLETDDGDYSYSVTDIDTTQVDDPGSETSKVTRQGPLLTGHFMNLGTFRTLIRQVAQSAGLPCEHKAVRDLGVRACEIYVISIYGPESGPIGAKRRFLLDGGETIRPDMIDTESMASRRARIKMRQWLHDFA